MENSIPPTPPADEGDEFNLSENAVLGETARWIGIWAWFAIAIGVIMGIIIVAMANAGEVALPAAASMLLLGLVFVTSGIYFRRAGRSLRSVVETDGDGSAHLMSALGNLRSAFRVIVILTAAAFAVGMIHGFMEAR